MTYSVKEIFYTLQGEGTHAGRPAVFCRFSGCNLWSGREADRPTAVCNFCDTDFVGTDGTLGGKYPSASALAKEIASLWPPSDDENRFVVLTGGEPMLQIDSPLIECLHRENFFIAVETNGTIKTPQGIDWLCVSPKMGSTLALTGGDELKLVFPQDGLDPTEFEHLSFSNFVLQPMDGANTERNTQLVIEFCKENPRWKLSLQLHKIIGIR